MAALDTLKSPSVDEVPAERSSDDFGPIHFLYTFLHESIRRELELLASLLTPPAEGCSPNWAELQRRYAFLRDVYKYHSSAEDEVIYPALEAKVANVTRSYSVEHEDEEDLLDTMVDLIGKARHEGAEAKELLLTVRQLAWRVKTTVSKHLSKEEAQLLPLLETNFSPREQGSLVAQFFCYIPLSMVTRVLSWAKPCAPASSRAALRNAVSGAVQDELLRDVLLDWLHRDDESETFTAAQRGVACHRPVDDTSCGVEGEEQDANNRPPALLAIAHIHAAMRAALAAFAKLAASLAASPTPPAPEALRRLQAKERFIHAVCTFHSASEDDVIYPALAALHRRGVSRNDASDHGCCCASSLNGQEGASEGASHEEESGKFGELRRLLTEIELGVRRRSGHERQAASELAVTAAALATGMAEHMAGEERGALAELAAACPRRAQRAMLWAMLRAMPLRLLERVMPWVAGRLDERERACYLEDIALGAGEEEHLTVRLLTRWALRGVAKHEDKNDYGDNDDAACWLAGFCGVGLGHAADGSVAIKEDDDRGEGVVEIPGGEAIKDNATATTEDDSNQSDDSVVVSAAVRDSHSETSQASRGSTRKRDDITSMVDSKEGSLLLPAPKRVRTVTPIIGTTKTTTTSPSRKDNSSIPTDSIELAPAHLPSGPSPIDHIFQFHNALRLELLELETSISQCESVVRVAENLDSTNDSLHQLAGRFQFLRGIYHAHSRSEDEVVFPALESKKVLRNVSHAYALDHEQEEAQFATCSSCLDRVLATTDLRSRREALDELACLYSGVRGSLETHIRAEEMELWPLFAEHFPVKEQEHLVGSIIGRSGADVLTAMLPWVRQAMTPEEEDAMMLSLRSAASSTAFDAWLGAALGDSALHSGTPRGKTDLNVVEISPHLGDMAQSCCCGVQHQASSNSGTTTSIMSTICHHPSTAPLPPQSASPSGSGQAAEMRATLAEVAQYLESQGLLPYQRSSSEAEAGAVSADASTYTPGWDDIFRMNQKQLEAAVRRVSADTNLEPERKAYLIQNLMASKYVVTQQRLLLSSSSSISGEAGAAKSPTTTTSGQALKQDGMATMKQPEQEQEQDAAVREEDCTVLAARGADKDDKTRVQKSTATTTSKTPLRSYADAERKILGCRHYRRRAMLVAPCCDRAFVCRFCHDDACDHSLDRYAVREMVCMECGLRQAVAGQCSGCGVSMAKYYCKVCHLFDDDPDKDIYHCPFCNFCRQGKGPGIDSFHCMACNACMSLELFNKHKCKEQSLKRDCPVCSDTLFESKHPVKELPCGHFMHSHCFAAYTRYAYTCPLCFKSLGNLEMYWRMIDRLLEAEKLPPEYANRRQTILCNDCGARSVVPFHFVYHRCASCHGYNARVV